MKKILLSLGVSAMILSSCGTKSNAKNEEVKDAAVVETVAEEAAEKSCCDKDTLKADTSCCEKDSVKTETEESSNE